MSLSKNLKMQLSDTSQQYQENVEENEDEDRDDNALKTIGVLYKGRKTVQIHPDHLDRKLDTAGTTPYAQDEQDDDFFYYAHDKSVL